MQVAANISLSSIRMVDEIAADLASRAARLLDEGNYLEVRIPLKLISNKLLELISTLVMLSVGFS